MTPLPDPLPIGERLAGIFGTRVRALDTAARMVLATRRRGRTVGRSDAPSARRGGPWQRVVGRRGRERRGERARHLHPEGRVPPPARAICRLLRRRLRPIGARAHAVLAEVLDTDLDTDRRARGTSAPSVTEPDEDIACSLEASAERARQRGGASAAAFLLWRAADLTPDRERATRRFLEAARAELVGGRSSRALEILGQARASGLGERHRAEAAWTEALVHIVTGDVRQAAAVMPDALPAIDAGQSDVAVGACVAAMAATLTGGHLIEEPTRQAIAAAAGDAVTRCDIAEPVAQLVSGFAARLRGEHVAALQMLRSAVATAVADHTHLQAVAGRRVHVVYYDTTIAAAEVLDDRAWADLADQWALVGRRIGALSALPLALSMRSWLDVLQGRLGSAASHLAEIEEVVTLTGSRGLLGSPAPAQVLRDAWQGNDEAARTGARRMMQDAHERGQGLGIDHAYAALLVLELGAGRYDAALRAARHLVDHDTVVLGTIALPDVIEAADPRRRRGARANGLSTGCRNERPRPTHPGLVACSRAGLRWSRTATTPTNSSVSPSTSCHGPRSRPRRPGRSCCTASGCDENDAARKRVSPCTRRSNSSRPSALPGSRHARAPSWPRPVSTSGAVPRRRTSSRPRRRRSHGSRHPAPATTRSRRSSTSPPAPSSTTSARCS